MWSIISSCRSRDSATRVHRSGPKTERRYRINPWRKTGVVLTEADGTTQALGVRFGSNSASFSRWRQ